MDELLNQEYVIGMENSTDVSSAVIACEEKCELIKKILDFYNNRIWNECIYVINQIMTKVINEQKEEIKIYPKSTFSPIEYEEEFKDTCIKDNTYTIHWFSASWNSKKEAYTFLEVKHIKNPIKRKLLSIKKALGYYKRKLIKP